VLIGLLQTQRTLAYLLFLVALVNLIIALSKGRNDSGFARGLHLSHKIGILIVGRINVLIGVVIWILEGHMLSMWGAWAALLMWVPVELIGRRLIAPEVSLVQDGGQASGRLVAGVTIQLLLIAVIFGLMSART
jgi:hypothetical protein